MSVPHNPVQERVGHFVTKLMAFGRRAYARMYLVGASGSVYAFEPDPLCRDILRHRIDGDAYDCYSLDDAGEAMKINDRAAFTAQHADSFTNIFAVHRTQPQPACT